ncbi:ATP12-domain-containing protein [Hypoxylon cercidicola]|nr:ATP12-domain-containing protein [Hypoxylon cercidicola]
MKPPARALRLAIRQKPQCTSPISKTRSIPLACRHQIHTTPAVPATVSPIYGTGPPPEPPQPAADSASTRLERRKKQAELLEKAQGIREQSKATSSAKSSSKAAKESALRKRFWKHVYVHEVDGAWEVHLDTRPLRHPGTKEIVRLPLSKPLLAAALAVEWDTLMSAQQATRQHLIPLTSLVCRALDIADDDAARGSSSPAGEGVRAGIARVLMRYLDTDSLLCWAPPPRADDPPPEGTESLREAQRRAAGEVVGFLTSRVWPGLEIRPVLDGESIVPRAHPEATRQVIQGWVAGLSAWELAGLERGVLAGKGLLGAARLLVEWSEGFVGTGGGDGAGGGAEKRFGVEEAARLASLEVDWQTRRWGEVEDTHDVEKEDLRRQLGSVVLLVSGTGGR